MNRETSIIIKYLINTYHAHIINCIQSDIYSQIDAYPLEEEIHIFLVRDNIDIGILDELISDLDNDLYVIIPMIWMKSSEWRDMIDILVIYDE